MQTPVGFHPDRGRHLLRRKKKVATVEVVERYGEDSTKVEQRRKNV